MMSLKSDRNMEVVMMIGCVLNLYILGLALAGKNATFDMILVRENNVWEVFVLILLSKENVKRVQNAAISTAYKMMTLRGHIDLKMQVPTGSSFTEVTVFIWNCLVIAFCFTLFYVIFIPFALLIAGQYAFIFSMPWVCN